VSERSTCPGCASTSSSILAADQECRPCPYCGLGWEARHEINLVRARLGDEKLKAKIEELVMENARLKDRLQIFEYAHGEIAGQVDEVRERLGTT
jgi:hypothetical protein